MTNYKELYKKAQDEGLVKNALPEFVKLTKKNSTLLGRFLSKQQVKSSVGTGTFFMYYFDTDRGVVKTKFGSATDKEIEPIMHEGGVYMVTFAGQIKLSETTSKNVFEFEVIEQPEEDIEEDIPLKVTTS